MSEELEHKWGRDLDQRKGTKVPTRSDILSATGAPDDMDGVHLVRRVGDADVKERELGLYKVADHYI
jgi:hypothetical protein